ncbi:MAG: riboflavin synthase [Sphingobacteriales bacterium]|jgi:riboflavin synthase|nr:riboflavin synthase [Sphingobacteriales bacterium]
MFTGIIETIGIVRNIAESGTNKSFEIESNIGQELKTDQSLSHNGVCLTVERVENNIHRVTAIEETLKKSNLGLLHEGSEVNLERCMLMNGRIDGHIVQGHVDDTAVCTIVVEKEGSWEYEFGYNPKFAALVIEKGSICLNGISLTVFDVKSDSFRVAIIPYTYEHTNIKYIKHGDRVNIEFDLIGKYILRQNEIAAN